ncbi:MAG TPA: hypothetical protein VK929_16535 [Longimicrobiales bacterium]|nr:hypothetical protein [Longimicrobiales bacterium]
MHIRYGAAEVVNVRAGGIAEAAFEDMAFPSVGALHKQRSSAQHGLHEVAERPLTLKNYHVEVVRHHCVGKQTGVGASSGPMQLRHDMALQSPQQ